MRTPTPIILRRTALGLACLLAAICCVLGGTLAWLNTESGKRAVVQSAATALEPLGLRLELDDFTLTPGLVRAHGIRLADSQGVWLTISEVALHPRLTALLAGTVAVDSLRINAPVLSRLPLLPPSPGTDSAPSVFSGFSGLPVRLSLRGLSLEQGGIHAAVLMPPDPSGAPGAVSNPLCITVSATGEAEAAAHAPLTASLTLEADLPDAAALAALRHAAPPVTGAHLSTTLTLRAGTTLAATAAGTLSAIAGEENYPLDYSLDAALAGTTATLRTARIHGLGLDLDAAGGADTATLAATGKTRLTTTAGGTWSALLRRTANVAFDGEITLALEGSGGGTSPLTATLDLTGANLAWPAPDLDRLLGPALATRATLTGNGVFPAGTITATLDHLEAGPFTASAKAVFAAALLAGNAEPASAPTPFSLTAEADLRDLALLVPDVSGPLHATASLSGTSAQAAFTIDATGKELHAPAGTFRSARAAVSGSATLRGSDSAALSGTAAVSVGTSPAGPASLTAAWNLDTAPASGLTARLHDLALTLAGTHCQADISLALHPGADPVLAGSASARVDDWRALAALTDLPLTGEAASLDLRFSHAAAKQTATAQVRAGRLALPDAFSLRGLELDASVTDSNAPDITLTARTGAGAAGPLDWRSAAATVSARSGTGSFALALRSDTTASAALKPLVAPGKATPPAKAERLAAAGTFTLADARLTLTRLAAHLPCSPLSAYLTAPAVIRANNGLAVSSLSLAVTPGAGKLTLDAALTPAEAELDAVLSQFPIRLVHDVTSVPLPDGTINATARLRKKGPAVTGSLEATAHIDALPGSQVRAAPLAATLTATLATQIDPRFPTLGPVRNGARLTAALFLDLVPPAGTKPHASGGEPAFLASVPLHFTPAGLPVPDTAAPLAARLTWQGEAAPFWNLLPLPDRRLTGLVRVTGELSGTLAAPKHTVSAYLAGGTYNDAILGLLLENITLQAESAAAGLRLLAEAGDSTGGTIALEGDLLPSEAGHAMPRLAARARVTRLAPLHRDDLSLTLSGTVDAAGPLTAPTVRANLAIERGEVSLLSFLGGGVRTLPITDPAAPNGAQESAATGPLLDMRVTVPGRFFIRGRGLDSEWAGELAVTGPAAAPALTGALRPVRGAFDLLSKPFAFSGGEIRFFGGDRINPGLDLTLTYDGPAITAIVHAGGTARKPTLTMESRPALPQDQIIAAVLFGKGITELSRFEALQVAAGLQDLADIGTGGLNPLAVMRTKLGIDMLRLGSSGGDTAERRSVPGGAPGAANLTGGAPQTAPTPEEDTVPTLEAGKYINDAIYVGLEQGAAADSTGVRVDVELTPNLTLQGKTSARSSEVGIGWKKDY